MSGARRGLAEGLPFLSNYQSTFTTRSDASTWPKYERTWLNAAQDFQGFMRPGSPNTVTDTKKFL